MARGRPVALSPLLARQPFEHRARRAAIFRPTEIAGERAVTPAMVAGVTKRLWEMTDLVEMMEAFEIRATTTRG